MELTKPEEIANGLKSIFADAILNVEYLDMLTITVKREEAFKVIKKLKEDTSFGFSFLTTLCGLHYPADKPGQKEQLGVVYMLQNMQKNHRVRIKIAFPIEDPNVDSLTPLFDGANWMERETFDFYGIRFKGHPNLKRIYNVDDFGYFPYRKDFPLEEQTRTDKNDAMFGR